MSVLVSACWNVQGSELCSRKNNEQIWIVFVHRRMPSGDHPLLRFGSFEIDTDARVLRKQGVKIRLQEQPFEVLLALLEARGQIVTREQLRQRLWPQGTYVEFDHALNTAVKKIRAALCDDAAVPRYIETIPRRGYRFLAPLDTAHSTGPLLNTESGVSASHAAPSRRFRSVMIACAIGIPFLMLSAWMISRPSAPRNVTLAVLPFSNMNSASSSEPAIVTFPELLLQQLLRTHPAKLVIRTRLQAPAHELSSGNSVPSEIDYVLAGGVLRGEQHLHVTVELVRLSDQNPVWARDFDRDSNDAETEREIAAEIVGQMQRTLGMLSGEPR